MTGDPVGLDFGTSTTLVAQRVGAGVGVVPLGRLTNALPSLVRLDGTSLRAGEDAETAPPERVIRSVKRAITHRSESFLLTAANGDSVEISADDAIEAVLREAVRRAEAAGADLSPDRAVRLGCPALWDGEQRRRLLDIAARAGLARSRTTLVDEPVAAGVAWLSHRYLAGGERPGGRLLVFDMGGGTLDVAVLAVNGGPSPEVAVESCLGMPLAGDALDAVVARDLAAELVGHGIDVGAHPQPELAWALVERAARETKVRLTDAIDHPVVLPAPLLAGVASRAWQAPELRYHRHRLEAAFASQLDGACNLVISALRAARLARQPLTAAQLRALGRDDLVADIDFVLLVGGMSRIPYVRRRLEFLFPSASIVDDGGASPEEAVAVGLADGAQYQRIRLHRPAFDLVLEVDAADLHGSAGERVPVYSAYTPLYEPWQLYSGHSVPAYECWLRPPRAPARGHGLLRAVTVDGRPLDIRIDGKPVAGVPVTLGAQLRFLLTCDGRIEISDGDGQTTVLRAEGWPVPAPSTTHTAILDLCTLVDLQPRA